MNREIFTLNQIFNISKRIGEVIQIEYQDGDKKSFSVKELVYRDLQPFHDKDCKIFAPVKIFINVPTTNPVLTLVFQVCFQEDKLVQNSWHVLD